MESSVKSSVFQSYQFKKTLNQRSERIWFYHIKVFLQGSNKEVAMLCKILYSSPDLVIFDHNFQLGFQNGLFLNQYGKSFDFWGFKNPISVCLCNTHWAWPLPCSIILWTSVVLDTQATCNSQLSVCKICIIFPLDSKIGLHKFGLFSLIRN